MGRLEGQRAVVSASGGKMDGTIALRLAAEGCDVALNDLDAALTAPYAEQIRAMGRDVDAATRNKAHDELITLIGETVRAGLARDRLDDRAFDSIRDDLEFQRLVVQKPEFSGAGRPTGSGMAALK